MGEQIYRQFLGQSAALQKEQRIGIDLPDRCAMLATHIVVEDLKLRLGVDARFARQQQVAAALRRVCSCRAGMDHDLAAEDCMRGTVGNAFVQLDALAPRCSMIDPGMRVGDLASRDHGQPVEVHFSALPLLFDMQGITRDACAECEQSCRVDAAPARLDRTVTDVERVLFFALHTHVLQLRVILQYNFCHCVGKIYSVIQPGIIFDQSRAAIRLDHHQRSRIDCRRLFAPG